MKVELVPPDSRLAALLAADHAEIVAGYPKGRLFLDSLEEAMAVALVNGHAVRRRPVQIYRTRQPGSKRNSMGLCAGQLSVSRLSLPKVVHNWSGPAALLTEHAFYLDLVFAQKVQEAFPDWVSRICPPGKDDFDQASTIA